jgi:hypothetical protein
MLVTFSIGFERVNFVEVFKEYEYRYELRSLAQIVLAFANEECILEYKLDNE